MQAGDEPSETRRSHERAPRPRKEDLLGDRDPLCPVCLRPIKSDDMVTGRRDDLMHEACDYTRR